jgi:glyoxylase-like metal-dependent hydrolase (beta-lactamase superfamily II)/rhodanese-related sulfurtransferase
VDGYLEAAERVGCEIRHVFLTHLHADFISGHLELRDRVGAEIYLGAEASAEYLFTPVGDGDVVDVGNVRLQVLETPGHSPESISIVVYPDRDQATPHAVLTGDTLFIGDVGRPDLRASLGWSAETLAGMLYDSLRDKLLALPDDTLVYPAHGAGSLCGKNLSTDTVSTIGAQRRENYAMQPMGKEYFIAIVSADLPDTPAYFGYDAALNAKRRPTLDDALLRQLKPLSLDDLLGVQASSGQVLDTRDGSDFQQGHLRGSVNVGLGGAYATWCGTVLDHRRPIVLIAEPGRERESATRLGRIGFDNTVGYLDGGVEALHERPELVGRIERVTAAALAGRLGSAHPPQLLDVRGPREWARKRIDGAINMPLARLSERVEELDPNGSIVVQCESGYRSAVAASMLSRAGFSPLADLVGGVAEWERLGRPLAVGAPERARPA